MVTLEPFFPRIFEILWQQKLTLGTVAKNQQSVETYC